MLWNAGQKAETWICQALEQVQTEGRGLVNPCPAEPGYGLFCNQCTFRSVGFLRSQLIWTYTVYHQVCEFIATIWIKLSDWLKIRSGRAILIYSAGQGLRRSSWRKLWDNFFLSLHKNICCGYQFEVLQRGASKDYPQHMFPLRTGEKYSKIIIKYSLWSSSL